ncbi:sporulation protein YtfJ [Ammoniphilus oxalaticus]|uniref:Sporulation protein YtfJ n=1 Tax=Ammoniphilus oxalaticus TaxID=66863 RepID=A0A419SRE2_9BACL|nr:GerW family sporulation protein [Ammoniphilus oxalaticus]RKD27065.1 sporulation protein YtfJ [Ammoniphilus oxalaticus]
MAEHPIQGLMQTAMENLKEMVDVNTIVGDPVETPDGSIILPISKVGFGFASGGSDFEVEKESKIGEDVNPFGGGAGGGVSITPVAFLVVGKNGVKTIPLEGHNQMVDKIMDYIPQVIDKFSANKKAIKNQGEDPFDLQ